MKTVRRESFDERASAPVARLACRHEQCGVGRVSFLSIAMLVAVMALSSCGTDVSSSASSVLSVSGSDHASLKPDDGSRSTEVTGKSQTSANAQTSPDPQVSGSQTTEAENEESEVNVKADDGSKEVNTPAEGEVDVPSDELGPLDKTIVRIAVVGDDAICLSVANRRLGFYVPLHSESVSVDVLVKGLKGEAQAGGLSRNISWVSSAIGAVISLVSSSQIVQGLSNAKTRVNVNTSMKGSELKSATLWASLATLGGLTLTVTNTHAALKKGREYAEVKKLTQKFDPELGLLALDKPEFRRLERVLDNIDPTDITVPEGVSCDPFLSPDVDVD